MANLITNEDVFKDENKADVIGRLKDLENHRGWRDMIKVIELNKKIIEEKMFHEEIELEKIPELRTRREYLEQMMELPQWLIERLEATEPTEENFDPHY